MAWDKFTTPTQDWKVTGFDSGIKGVKTSPTKTILKFTGMGNGTAASKVTADGVDWGKNCRFDDSSGDDIVTGRTVGQVPNFSFYIVRNGTQMVCKYDHVYVEGDPLWQAQEGG